jgi:hypothetical protein
MNSSLLSSWGVETIVVISFVSHSTSLSSI